MKKVLFIITSTEAIGPNRRKTGYYLSEVSHPYHEFRKAGYQVDFSSVQGGTPPVDGYDLEDPVNRELVESPDWARLNQSVKLADVNISQYDAVFVPGGLGPMVDLADNPVASALIKEAYEAGKVVGAVCHGPVALAQVTLSSGEPLVKGKKVTSFSNAEEEAYAKEDVPFLLETALVDQGAIYSAAAPWQPHSIADGRLVTGQNPASAAGVAEKMINILERI